MRKKAKAPELNLPCFREDSPEVGSPELSMDDYYKAVVVLLQSMPRNTDFSPQNKIERFVIRDEAEIYSRKARKRNRKP